MKLGGVDTHFHPPLHGSGNPTPHSKIRWGPQSGTPTLPLKFASKYCNERNPYSSFSLQKINIILVLHLFIGKGKGKPNVPYICVK